MNGPVTVYIPATGEIVAHGRIDLDAGDSITYPGGAMISGHYEPATHWVTADAPDGDAAWVPHFHAVERPALPCAIDRAAIDADGVDAAIISGLPAGAEVSIDGGAWQSVAGGRLEFAASTPGTYALRLRAWPHREVLLEVIAS